MVLAAPAAAAIISGTVAEHRSGRVLARTRVTLESAAGSSPNLTQSVFADSTGQFLFAGLPAGTYLLRAERRGFAVARFGEKPSARSGTPIVLAADASYTADLRLRKLGVITGEVHDENRVGLAEFEVGVYRAGVPPRFVSSAYTDDRGRYRISGLEPGVYHVRSEARELADQQGLLATYFGQVLHAAEARTVTAAWDEETDGVSIEPMPGRLSSLAGTLVGPVAADVTLQTDAGLRTARVAPGGTFHFPQLVPGVYDLMAQSVDPAHAYCAHLRVDLGAGHRQFNVQLTASPTVRLRCEARGGIREIPGVSAFLRRREPIDDNSKRLQCGETATLSPGRWEIVVSSPPAFYVAAYTNARGGENAYEFSLSPAEERELTVTLRSRPASLSGRVMAEADQPAGSAPVLLYPLDTELRSRMGGVRNTLTTDTGEFRFAGLAPGRYELLSSYSLEQTRGLIWPQGQGKTVELEEGAEPSITIRLQDLP